ncbi:lipoyl protein ligase domain-containing protein [Lacticaseibacillus saniviri]|uniref:lipoyl protein ligase domain-containing protein n=1 Tax=Lacticaseibacillus saniviri TaxID=931533 RepID=UPI0006CFF20E|nr:hypothetical protein [Lacticaseibacillus saniviri]
MQATIGILDQHFSQAQALDSFAHTNTLLRLPDARADELFHFWTLDSTVILGMQDLKLPHLQSALQALSAAQYPYFVRNAGGLAVISDAQILNCSWFLKNTGTMSIDQAYLQFTQLMQDALAPFGKPIEHFEVTHSYCPGKFDLSINGKICGSRAAADTKGNCDYVIPQCLRKSTGTRGIIARLLSRR